MPYRYLIFYATFTIFILLSIFSLNWLIDPLWYGQGNRLSIRNFPFDERRSKTNLFLRSHPEDYDCIIFGSSRATLLRHSLFKYNRCFNYAFGGSSIDEYIAYAHFVKAHSPSIQKVYLGIDAFNFKPSVPHNIFEVPKSEHILNSYLSLDVFIFSLNSILNSSLKARYYNSQRDFEIATVENWPAYKPSLNILKSTKKCDRKKINRYREIQAIFPQAEVIGFSAPVSAWYVVNQLYRNGDILDCYLEANYKLSQEFHTVYDFTIPSSVTKNSEYSYDSNHYYTSVMDQVVQLIQGEEPSVHLDKFSGFGINVSDYAEAEYKLIHQREIEIFLAEITLQPQ